jgi:hypothetical protein
LLYWGYIVTFTKFLTIYHSRIHPLHHYSLSPYPYSRNSFNRSHFSIHIHVYRIFLPYSPSKPFPYFLPPPTGT